jgi:hypothetical protein
MDSVLSWIAAILTLIERIFQNSIEGLSLDSG